MKRVGSDRKIPVAREGSLEERSPDPRYRIERRVGAGGMGVVYEAFDCERKRTVALKTMRSFSPAALYRFKQEFRTLMGVLHPNLVTLYELTATDADNAFFTMEFVSGVDFLTYAGRPRAVASSLVEPGSVVTSKKPRASSHEGASIGSATPLRGSERRPTLAKVDRLRPALGQLVAGVSALHAAGKLHRDIKPSNVLVTPEGRVVILDFGAATDVAAGEHRRDRELIGTARYMAPEQATDVAPTAASDWYSVGVMLYEALVGRPPFEGRDQDMMVRKSLEPPPPSDFVDGVPEDLEALCRALLRPDPRSRPDGPALRRMLDASSADASRTPAPGRPSSEPPGGHPLVGRDEHLRLLRDAFETARQGRFVTVRLRGSSGMGKSELVRHFLDGVASRGDGVTLHGRAYERESIPYKALDGVVDALSAYLVHLTSKDGPSALPSNLADLERLFPVLRRVGNHVRTPDLAEAQSPSVARSRAVVSLRGLLLALAARQPLVLSIDDAQWGDVDSARLLVDLVRAPFDAPIVLLLAFREEEADSSSFLVDTRALWPLGCEVRDVRVGPLVHDDARTLALRLLGSSAAGAAQTADAIATESGGNPLLVSELARSLSESARSSPPREVRLEALLDARAAHLPPDDRLLLELVAVSARPVPIPVAARASGLADRLETSIATLRDRGFVRAEFRTGQEVVEIAHDRMREVLVARLSEATLREHHGSLASAFEAAGLSDPEILAVHLLGAGDRARGSQQAERAADAAAAKLAFVQAARLYRMALEALDERSADAQRLRRQLADLLARAGRGADAAAMYTAAAAHAAGLERMELERNAAEHLLLSGRVDEGVQALNRVLLAAGLRAPRTVLGALVSALAYRIVSLVLGFRPRSSERPDEARRADHLRIEALYAFVVGLSFVHVVYGMSAQARHLVFALRSGSRYQVYRAAVIEVTNASASGGREGRRETKLAGLVKELAAQITDRQSLAFGAGVDGQRLFLHGRWREAHERLRGLYDEFRDQRSGWFANWHLFNVYALGFLGELGEARRIALVLMADARERGDLYTTVNLGIGHCATLWLALDEVESARTRVREAMSSWTQSGFFLQHYRAVLAEANIALYLGEGEEAYDRVERSWRALRRSFLLNVQYLRADAYFVRARCALATAAGPRRDVRLAEATRLARKLEAEAMPWTRTLAALVRAGLSMARRDDESTRAELRLAASQASSAEMGMHAAVARLRLGHMLPGLEGRKEATEASLWMIAQDVRQPERLAAMLVPLPSARK